VLRERERESRRYAQIGDNNRQNQESRGQGKIQELIGQEVLASDIIGSRKAKTSNDTDHQKDYEEIPLAHRHKGSPDYLTKAYLNKVPAGNGVNYPF
jgi:hypothetical protein